MEDNVQSQHQGEQVDFLEVTPEESPSENYFVTEHLQKMPNVFARGLVYLVLLALVSTVLYSILAKIDIIVEGAGVARPTSHKIRIVSDRDGHLERIHISEGQFVEKDAPLFEIRSKETLEYLAKVDGLRRSIPLKEEQYSLKTSSASERLRQFESEHRNSLRVNQLKLDQIASSLHSLESDLRYWRKEVDYLTREAEGKKELCDAGILSLVEYNYAKSRLEKAQMEEQKILSGQEITLKEKRIIEENIERQSEDYKSKREILEKEIKELELDKEDTVEAMQNELTLYEDMLSLPAGSSSVEDQGEETGKIVRAESAGIISELYYRNVGEYVQKSNLLCTIVPSASPLYMDVIVANKDIGFMEEGMEIKYKFSAFPHTDYGTLSGKVSAISPSAVEDEKGGFVFHVRGTLDKPYFEIAARNYPIKAGMTATAELVTEKKSIFALVITKLKQ